MCILMFTEVLRESEHFAAVLAGESLLPTMDVIMTFQRELGCESFPAALMLAYEMPDPRRINLRKLIHFAILVFIDGLSILVVVLSFVVNNYVLFCSFCLHCYSNDYYKY